MQPVYSYSTPIIPDDCSPFLAYGANVGIGFSNAWTELLCDYDLGLSFSFEIVNECYSLEKSFWRQYKSVLNLI